MNFFLFNFLFFSKRRRTINKTITASSFGIPGFTERILKECARIKVGGGGEKVTDESEK